MKLFLRRTLVQLILYSALAYNRQLVLEIILEISRKDAKRNAAASRHCETHFSPDYSHNNFRSFFCSYNRKFAVSKNDNKEYKYEFI